MSNTSVDAARESPPLVGLPGSLFGVGDSLISKRGEGDGRAESNRNCCASTERAVGRAAYVLGRKTCGETGME